MRLPERLPELKGRWLAAYKALWFAMLAISLAALTAGQWREVSASTTLDRQVHGAGLRAGATDTELTFGPISPAARAAGIAPDSELLAVDGRPVSSEPTVANLGRIAEALDGRDGRAVALRLRAPDGTVREVRVVRGPGHIAAADREAPVSHSSMTAIAVGSWTLDALILMAGAILLFARRKSDPVAALLSLGLLSVPASEIAHLASDPVVRRTIRDGLDVVPMVCILLGMAVFPEGRFTPRWSLLIVPAIAAWGAVIVGWGDNAPTVLQLSVALPALLLTVASLAARYVRLPQGPQRQQLKWVMLGFAGFIVCGLLQAVLAVIDEAVTHNSTHLVLLVAINLLTAAQGLCLVGGLLISLLRHRLYDADAAISRSAAYAGLTVGLIAIFAGFETLLESLGEEWFGASAGAAAGAIAAALATLFLVPLHHKLSAWAEKRFQRDLSRLRAGLPQLLAEMRTSSDPKELADDALRLVMRGVHAIHGAILLTDGGRMTLVHAEGIGTDGLADRLAGELPANPSPGAIRADDPALPIRVPLVTPRGVTAGWLALGPHPDGSLYGKDDREALDEVAVPLARALDFAADRARREAAHESERRELADQVARLEQKLAEVIGLAVPPQAGTA